MQLNGRRVLLTGASRGIGAGLARGLAAAGSKVALVARPSDDLTAVADDVGGTAYPCDLSDLTTIDDLVARVLSDGPVDVLINNAGVAGVGWFVDRTPDEIDRIMTVNLLAPMHLTHRLLPQMIERRAGHVVNISSMAAVIAPPGLVAYGASKSGLSHFTAGLRADLRDHPIGFTTVHFASVKTDMDAEARSYGPLRMMAEQSQGRDATTMESFVTGVIGAITNDEPEVRFPTFMAPLMAVANLPRKAGRLMFKQAPSHESRP